VVFCGEQNVPFERERIPLEDERSWHIIVYLDDVPVATGRVLPDGQKFILGRIATLKEHRGRGLGKLVTQKLTEKALEMGAVEVVLSSQTHAKGFYEQFGFEVCSDEYMDAGIPHVSMRLRAKEQE
jgi:predicted GNAT family N-acyltransferase